MILIQSYWQQYKAVPHLTDLFGTSAPWLAISDAHIFEGPQNGSQFFVNILSCICGYTE